MFILAECMPAEFFQTVPHSGGPLSKTVTSFVMT